jgi:hypothetical protein
LTFGGAGDRPAENNQEKGYKMRTFMTGLLKGRMVRWGILPVVLVFAGLSLAWDQHHYRLGGAWVGAGSVLTWNCLQAPLDAEGRTAAIRVDPTSWGPEFAGLLAAFGADAVTGTVGQARMISRDTQKWTLTGYAVQVGNPQVVKAIFVYSGTWKFNSPDTAVLDYSLNVYAPTANGYPDLNAPIIVPGLLPATGLTDKATRVPLP